MSAEKSAKGPAGKLPVLSGNITRLATMPFAPLLPKLGELGGLNAAIDNFTARLKELQLESETIVQDDIRNRLGEEAMLIQVLSWLGVEDHSLPD